MNIMEMVTKKWCLISKACWESCQGRLDSTVPEMSLFQNPSLHTVNT